MEDVGVPRQQGQRAEVPADVSYRHEGAPAAAERVLLDPQLRLPLEAVEEAAEVTRRAGLSQGERRGVEGELHGAATILPT